jgi:hypothetical protein
MQMTGRRREVLVAHGTQGHEPITLAADFCLHGEESGCAEDLGGLVECLCLRGRDAPRVSPKPIELATNSIVPPACTSSPKSTRKHPHLEALRSSVPKQGFDRVSVCVRGDEQVQDEVVFEHLQRGGNALLVLASE